MKEVIKIIIKKITKTSIIIIIIIIAIILVSIFCIINNHNKIKIGSISTKNIVSFKIRDITCNQKNVSNNAEREKIINLINSVEITRYNIPVPDGDGYSVEITYSNGQKFSVTFLSDTAGYSNNDGRATWCNIDKDIINDLQQCYSEN